MSGFGSLLQREDFHGGGKLPSIEPLYANAALGDCLLFETYVSSGVVEVPEMDTPAHVIILRSGSPSVIEWRQNGRDHKTELPPGSVSLLPAGLREAARVFRPLPGVASILQMQPGFVQRAVGKIAKGGKVELVPQRVLKDAQIARLMESLRADVVAGSPSGDCSGSRSRWRFQFMSPRSMARGRRSWTHIAVASRRPG